MSNTEDKELRQRVFERCDGCRANGNMVFANILEIFKDEVPRMTLVRWYEEWLVDERK